MPRRGGSTVERRASWSASGVTALPLYPTSPHLTRLSSDHPIVPILARWHRASPRSRSGRHRVAPSSDRSTDPSLYRSLYRDRRGSVAARSRDSLVWRSGRGPDWEI